MILLLDIGNTRIKWAQYDAGVLGPVTAAVHTGVDLANLVDRIFQIDVHPLRCLISNVGGFDIGNACAAAAKERWSIDAEVIESTAQTAGVTNAYREPAKLGTDRWLAVIAAHAMKRGAACIVSVGTAMTIDGVDASGQHLGGVIVPGPELMISSLLKNTSDIARRMTDEDLHHGVFASHTRGAVRQGCAHALAALVDRAYGEMSQSLGTRPLLLITGGASDHITPLLAQHYESHPDLVLRGLAILADTK